MLSVEHTLVQRVDQALASQFPDPATRPAAEPLAAYLTLLRRWNERFDLTGFQSLESMLLEGVMQSLGALAVLPDDDAAALDAGSGAGFPGIPLALARPERGWTLLEPRRRRASFLREACLQLALRHVTVRRDRLEHVAVGSASLITSRAVGGIAPLVERALAPAGCWIVAAPVGGGETPTAPYAGLRLDGEARVAVGATAVRWLRWRAD